MNFDYDWSEWCRNESVAAPSSGELQLRGWDQDIFNGKIHTYIDFHGSRLNGLEIDLLPRYLMANYGNVYSV